MARIIERSDGVVTERVTEDSAAPTTTTYVETSGRSGIGGVLAVLVVIVALAIAAYVFLGMSRSDNARPQAVSHTASSVAPAPSAAAPNDGAPSAAAPSSADQAAPTR